MANSTTGIPHVWDLPLRQIPYLPIFKAWAFFVAKPTSLTNPTMLSSISSKLFLLRQHVFQIFPTRTIHVAKGS